MNFKGKYQTVWREIIFYEFIYVNGWRHTLMSSLYYSTLDRSENVCFEIFLSGETFTFDKYANMDVDV